MDLMNLVMDSDLERDGVWFDLDEVTSIKVARVNSPEYQKALREAMKPYKVQIKKGTVPDYVLHKIIGDVMSDHLVKDWKGLIVNGQEIEYSKKEAKRILTDPKFAEFKDIILEFANDAERYRAEEIEDTSGNSQDG